MQDEDSETIRCHGPPGFLDKSTSEDEPSDRIRASGNVNIHAWSQEERKAAAPTISGVYEKLFIDDPNALRSVDNHKYEGERSEMSNSFMQFT